VPRRRLVPRLMIRFRPGRPRLLDVLARRRNVDLFEVVVVVVGRDDRRGHVGDVHAVHRPDLVLRAGAFRHEVGLCPFRCPRCHAIDEHRHRAQQRRRIAGRGIAFSSSEVKLVAVPFAFASTIGDSPLTVIVSATAAIFIDIADRSSGRPAR